MGLKKYKLGELITQRREKYDGNETLCSWGVSRDGFIRPKQEDADTSIYNVFYRNDFVFNPARMELNSIALNSFYDKAICSSLYEIFYVTREDIILPEYLNMFIKRDEFARRCWYEAIGSARNYFRVGDLSQFEITLPSIDQQRKYVDVYLALQNNLAAYQSKADELKMVCDGYLDKLKAESEKVKIGDFIEQYDERNLDGLLKLNSVKGISTEKSFIDTKADMNGVSLTSYKVVATNTFVYVPDTSRRGDKMAIALNRGEESLLVSSIYTTFKSKDTLKLLPEYLFMFFDRPEFDRYARFNSWGSAREVFTMDDMNDVRIPIPDIKVQREIVNIHRCYIERQRIAEALKEQLKNICPVLIRGSLGEKMN
ncbi:MAG: restriction endonuclease subunit S [Bacteroidales bacterium]|nr:restriction endonuclease subunit S [Bacteroidales bacterium]